MEDDFFSEEFRLKKLLEDSILQVEKENMTILQSSNRTYEDSSHPIKRNVKPYPCIRTSPPTKLTESSVNEKDVHSRIHFLKDLESSLLPSYNKRKFLLDKSRNKYIPCAVPLSPPITLRQDEEVIHYPNSIKKNVPEMPSLIHTCEKYACERKSPVHTCESFFKSSTVVEKTFPPVPVNDVKETTVLSERKKRNQAFSSVPVHHVKETTVLTERKKMNQTFPSMPIYDVEENTVPAETKKISQIFPSMQIHDVKESTILAERQQINQVKNAYGNASFASSDKSSSFRTSNNSFLFNQKMNVSSSEAQIPEYKPNENLNEFRISESKPEHDEKDEDQNKGFQLQISLDSCSTRDVINKMLHRIPGILNKYGDASNETKRNICNATEKGEDKEKLSHVVSEYSKISRKESQTVSSSSQIEHESFGNSHEFNKIPQKESQIVSSSTQTAFESLNNFQEFSKMWKFVSSIQNQAVSSYTQTDEKEEVTINNHELHHTVKEIVVEALKDMHIYEHLITAKLPFATQKVDSGIQSEIESDIPEHSKFRVSSKCILLEPKNHKSDLKYNTATKGVQVNFNFIQPDKVDYIQQSSNDDPDSCKGLNETSLIHSNRKSDTANISERNAFPAEKSCNKMELMLEKIYEQVCQEKDASRNFNDIPFNNSVHTRDVAVQFNRLCTSTKATSTSEIIQVDASCQYDIPLMTDSAKKSCVEASVQVENSTKLFDKKNQVNTYTQYEQKGVLDAVSQTEALVNSEHSAMNTSMSTTPDSMFMDDILSEGEIHLPCNLRLSSPLGGSLRMSIPDSSDTSMKEKDYSLSEGEVFPAMLSYLNLCPYNCYDVEDNGQQRHMYTTKLTIDSKNITSSSADSDKLCENKKYGKNIHLQLSSSVLSEDCNSSASLSSRETSVHLTDSFHKTEKYAFNTESGGKKSNTGHLSVPSSSKPRNLSGLPLNPSSIESELHENSTVEEHDLKNSTQVTLQTVNEEVHSMFDQ